MTSTLKFNIKPVDSIDDTAVLDQLPERILKDLGSSEGTGFDLRTNKRDLFFQKGSVRYGTNDKSVDVFME